jgi:hypothetical protein
MIKEFQKRPLIKNGRAIFDFLPSSTAIKSGATAKTTVAKATVGTYDITYN